MADKVTTARPVRARSIVGIAGLLVALVALWVGPLLFAPQIGDEAFPGADAEAIKMVEATGYEPWINSVFAPGAEVVSGLFAVQAAIGAGVLLYVIGYLHGRTRTERVAGRGGGPATGERGGA